MNKYYLTFLLLLSGISAFSMQNNQKLFASYEQAKKYQENPTTELHKAIEEGKQDKVLKLLNDGVNIDSPNEDGNTALYTAVLHNKPKIALILIECGADVNASSSFFGDSPLYLAAQKNFPLLVSALLKKGANVNVRDSHGNTPLHTALINEYPKIALNLINYTAINSEIDKLEGFFIEDELHPDKELHINLPGAYNESPLHIAAGYGFSSVVDALLSRGAHINVITNYEYSKWTPLYNAIIEKHPEIALTLIEHGADINLSGTNHQGDSPLHLAAKYGFNSLVKALLSKDANINALNKHGETPLLCALRFGATETALTLIKQSPSINMECDEFEGFFIEETFSELNTDRHDHINLADKEGNSPLHIAAKKGLPKVFSALISAGANVKAKNKDGLTAHESIKKYGLTEIEDEFYNKCKI